MNSAHLVRMLNRIGAFFSAMPDPEEAQREIAQHVRRYWEPRMRRQLLEHLDAQGDEGLAPLVAMALRRHRGIVADTP